MDCPAFESLDVLHVLDGLLQRPHMRQFCLFVLLVGHAYQSVAIADDGQHGQGLNFSLARLLLWVTSIDDVHVQPSHFPLCERDSIQNTLAFGVRMLVCPCQDSLVGRAARKVWLFLVVVLRVRRTVLEAIRGRDSQPVMLVKDGMRAFEEGRETLEGLVIKANGRDF